jgi:hypothetical protein
MKKAETSITMPVQQGRITKTAYGCIIMQDGKAMLDTTTANKGVAAVDYVDDEADVGYLKVTLTEIPSSWPLVLCPEAKPFYGNGNYNEFCLELNTPLLAHDSVNFAACYE